MFGLDEQKTKLLNQILSPLIGSFIASCILWWFYEEKLTSCIPFISMAIPMYNVLIGRHRLESTACLVGSFLFCLVYYFYLV